MIPRAVEQVFRVAEELKHKGWEYRMEGQFLEIVGFGQNKSDSLIKLRRILSIMKLSTTSSERGKSIRRNMKLNTTRGQQR